LPDDTPTKKDHPAAARGRSPKGTEEPAYMSVRHRAWHAREMDFVWRHSKAGLPDRHPDAVEEQDLANYAASLADPDTRDQAICELIEKVGPEVFWLAGPGPSGPLVLYAVRDRIRGAYDAARSGSSVSEREAAGLFLRAVGKALAGDRRGRREGIVLDTLQVRRAYYRRLYRLEQGFKLLREWPWPASRLTKIHRVARACGLPGMAFRWLFFDADGTPRRPLSPAEVARTWTALRFGSTQQTILNHLAPSALQPSRK
jgi:hypothetical protein